MHNIYVLVLCFLFQIAKVYADAGPPFYQLHLSIQDSITQKPIAYAKLYLDQKTQPYISDAQGNIRIDSLAKGQYHIDIEAEGYHLYHIEIFLSHTTTYRARMCPLSHHMHDVIIHKEKVYNGQTNQYQNTLNNQQTDNKRGQNLTELLQQINGIQSVNTGPTISKPVIRGLHSQRVLMLVNQYRLEGQQWGTEHAPEIDVFSADRIEVVKGAASVMYGAEAIGAVVNVLPRPYRSTNGIGGMITMNAFSNNRQGAISAYTEGAHLTNQRLQWRLQGSMRKAGDSRTPDYIISNTGMEEQNLAASMKFRINELWHVEGSASWYQALFGIMSASHIGNLDDLNRALSSSRPLIELPFTYTIGRPYQDIAHRMMTIKWVYTGKRKMQSTFSYSFQRNLRKEYDNDAVYNRTLRSAQRPAFDLNVSTHVFSYKATQQAVKRHNSSFGADLMFQNNIASGLMYLIPDYTSVSLGVFALHRITHKQWTLDMGVRFDYKQQQVNHVDRFRQYDTLLRFAMPTGVITLSKKVNAYTTLIGTVSSAWRAPSINELYSDGLHIGTAIYERGNSNLKAEQAYVADMAYQVKNELWFIDISAYTNWMPGFIYQQPAPTPILTIRGAFPLYEYKQTDALLAGTDVQVLRKLTSWLQAEAAYSYLYAQDVNADVPLIFMPANRLRTTLGLRKNNMGKCWNNYFDITCLHVFEQTRYVQGSDYVPPPPAYTVWQIQMGTSIKIANQYIRCSLSVQNLFNTTYRDYLSRFRYFTDEPGRNLILRITIPIHMK